MERAIDRAIMERMHDDTRTAQDERHSVLDCQHHEHMAVLGRIAAAVEHLADVLTVPRYHGWCRGRGNSAGPSRLPADQHVNLDAALVGADADDRGHAHLDRLLERHRAPYLDRAMLN